MAAIPSPGTPARSAKAISSIWALRRAVGFKMAGGAIACFVHAVFPFLFVKTGSETIESLHRQIHKRVDAPNWERHPII